jgi:ABC-type multidrug transport system fused ATPase/permease subunit
VERINEYTQLKNEGVWLMEGKQPSLHEAPNGRIQFEGVSLKYREEDDPVLHRLSFQVDAGQKIGIVGRTGAG